MKSLRRFFVKMNLSDKVQKIIDKDKLYNCQNYAPLPFVINKASGAYVYDVDGKKYLDCITGYSVMNQGHLHPRIKKVIIDQLDVLTHTGRGIYHDKLADATEFLTKTLNYDRAILMNTGVEAGETAVKFARRWGYEVKKIPKDQAWVLFAKENFWGRTIAACGSSDDPDRFHNFGPFGLNFKLLDYNNADVFEEELKANPHVAAIMLEPIQGEAGVIVPSNGFLQKIRQLCDKYNVLLILDEVQTGLGRTGKMLCQENWNVKADMVTLGKALSGGFFPISAVLGKKEIFDLIVPGAHGSTFGGNPLACVTMQESVKVIIEENLVQNSAEKGEFILKGLKEKCSKFTSMKNIRGKGLFFGFDICQKEGPDIKEFIFKLAEKGILTKNPRPDKLRFAPALIINQNEAEMIVNAVAETFEDLHK